ncbi:hypothetical protein HanRHA438_Chr03g0114041 [Helianthus annuus]|nr:hypothetical protein HanIR_Chr03g0112521 [Helianthus annuus]KAJ0935006.1 hypothetical protein HanRHA438_Chr03g0114041 [Helianthus annuus]
MKVALIWVHKIPFIILAQRYLICIYPRTFRLSYMSFNTQTSKTILAISNDGHFKAALGIQ